MNKHASHSKTKTQIATTPWAEIEKHWSSPAPAIAAPADPAGAATAAAPTHWSGRGAHARYHFHGGVRSAMLNAAAFRVSLIGMPTHRLQEQCHSRPCPPHRLHPRTPVPPAPAPPAPMPSTRASRASTTSNILIRHDRKHAAGIGNTIHGRSDSHRHWDTCSCAHSGLGRSPRLPANPAVLFAVAQPRK